MHGQWPLVGGGERSVLAQSMEKGTQRRRPAWGGEGGREWEQHTAEYLELI